MARTREGALLTDLHYRRQFGLRAATVRDIIKLWPMWRLDEPGSYDRLVEAVTVLARMRARDSAALAARYYEMFREVEMPGGVRLTWGKAAALAEPPTAEQIRAAMDATGRWGVYRALAAGRTPEEAMAIGLVRLSGSIARLALNCGRETVLEAVRRDEAALGWARVTDAKPCAFCAMLASRGPVYKERTVRFRAHDHCTCTAEPVYEGSNWPGRAREFHDLWQQTKHDRTTSPLNAFRRALKEPAET